MINLTYDNRRSCLFRYRIFVVVLCWLMTISANDLQAISIIQIEQHLQDGCAIMANQESDPVVIAKLKTLIRIYANDDRTILIGQFNQVVPVWSNGDPIKYQINGNLVNQSNKTLLTIFPKRMKDRTCLIALHQLPVGERYSGDQGMQALVDLINNKCQLYRSLNGNLNRIGMRRKSLLDNLHATSDGSTNLKHEINEPVHQLNSDIANNTRLLYRECKIIQNTDATTDFITSFLLKSQPVIIKNAINDWPARTKWNNQYFKSKIGNKRIHIKLTENGEFEGCESVTNWKSKQSFMIPQAVRQQLQFDDLVVVRPATADLPFTEFLQFVTGENTTHQFSAYLEYTSIKDYMPNLTEDVKEMPFIRNILDLKHLNIWLSDGNTLGKLHFDPYDNFLCQVMLRDNFNSQE